MLQHIKGGYVCDFQRFVSQKPTQWFSREYILNIAGCLACVQRVFACIAGVSTGTTWTGWAHSAISTLCRAVMLSHRSPMPSEIAMIWKKTWKNIYQTSSDHLHVRVSFCSSPGNACREHWNRKTQSIWRQNGPTAILLLKSLDEGFSTFSMVCACLNPPPCIKGAFFFPSSKVLVSQSYSWKTFPCSKDFSRPSVFPQWRFALKAAKKIKNKIKSRRQTHTPGKNTCDRTLQICIKHAMCFSQWYVPVLIFLKDFIFIFSPRRSRRGTLGILPPEVP